MYILLALPLSFLVLGIIVGVFISAPAYKGPKRLLFDGKRFFNYDNVKAKGFIDIIKWAITRNQGKWKYINDLPATFPSLTENELTIYFVNHATFLIQWKGLNILTDPVWSERTSPFTFAGPKRKRPPGIAFDALPKIDYVLISHNHYDHLDIPTVKKLWERDKPQFIVPLGVDKYLNTYQINNIIPTAWWESIELSRLKVEMVPAQHFSGRGILDRDKTLWGGYMIYSDKQKLYFAGDTGYNERMFIDISKRHSVINIALLPIGAYQPRWFMSPIHLSPEEAVKVHQLMNIQKSIGMHFGTFPLADDGQYDPPDELELALKKYLLSKSGFILLKEGSRYNI